MCLAVPGKVVKRDDDLKATVDMMGIERPVSLRLVPTAQVGDSRFAPVSTFRHFATPGWLASSSIAFMSLSATAASTLWKSAARIP